MGLGIVEYVMALEETLELKIADDEAGRWETLGDVLKSITPRRAAQPGCSTQRAFHRLRSSLMNQCHPRRGLRTTTPLATVAAGTWRSVTKQTHLEFPARRLSTAARAALGLGSVAVAGVVRVHVSPMTSAGSLALSAATVDALDRRFGRHRTTLGSRSIEVGVLNYARLGCWSRPGLRAVIPYLGATEAGVAVGSLSEQTRLIDLFQD